MTDQYGEISALIEQWIQYMNGDSELLKRVSQKGLSPHLDGREVIELKLNHRKMPYTIEIKENKFYLYEKEAEDPLFHLSLSLPSFKRLALTEDRVIWSLLDEKTKFTVSPYVTWHDFITILEIFVALQESIDKKKLL